MVTGFMPGCAKDITQLFTGPCNLQEESFQFKELMQSI
jgi:hypothetical protein